jgi:HEAT repeats
VNPFRIPGRDTIEDEGARIARLGESGDLRSILDLLPFLPPEAHPAGSDAADAAHRILGRAIPTQLAWFDSWFRSRWAPPKWKDVRLGDAEWARRFPGVVALASFHANGFVREVAVRLLASFEDGSELPFLLVRANDWVAAVQSTALAVLFRRVTVPYAMYWVHCLPLAARLGTALRRKDDLARLRKKIDALLTEPTVRSVLASGLADKELDVRRECLRLASSLAVDEAQPLLLTALADPDPLVANRASDALCARLRSQDVDTVLRPMLSHRVARVRVQAIHTACLHAPQVVVGILRDALLDEARCVRELARYELSRLCHPAPDAADYYRAALGRHEGRVRIAALEGLAETGTREDVPTFRGLLRDANARIRAAAIVGLGRCDPSGHLDELAAALKDSSAKVRRTSFPYARMHLGRHAVRRVPCAQDKSR